MIWKRALIVCASIISVLLPGVLHLPGADADPTAQTDQLIVGRINTAEFLGRYKYEASISPKCDFLLKEINPRCPDLRTEISFNVADVKASVDDFSKALVVESVSGNEVIRQRQYYRGPSVKGRRFCEAPEGSTLKSEDEMLSENQLFYSDDIDLLGELVSNVNVLGEACRQAATG